ncbi:hypothetical protein GCM10027256_05850 [Novispirillum itersonii subsp. nipponicum]
MRHSPPGGQQHQPSGGGRVIGQIALPRQMADHAGQQGIIHSGPFQVAVIPDKTARFDNIKAKIKTGGKAQQGAGILRNVRLVQRKAHGGKGPSVRAAGAGNTPAVRDFG